jgi:transposase
MPKRYPPEFRRKVLDLAASGCRVAQVPTDLDISEQYIYLWRGQYLIDTGQLLPRLAQSRSLGSPAAARVTHRRAAGDRKSIGLWIMKNALVNVREQRSGEPGQGNDERRTSADPSNRCVRTRLPPPRRPRRTGGRLLPRRIRFLCRAGTIANRTGNG